MNIESARDFVRQTRRALLEEHPNDIGSDKLSLYVMAAEFRCEQLLRILDEAERARV